MVRLATKVPSESGSSARPAVKTEAPKPKPAEGGIWTKTVMIGVAM